MKKSKFTEEQITFALHQAQTGVSVEEVRLSLAQDRAFAYNWQQQHPPRLSTMRTMGGYFFPGAEK